VVARPSQRRLEQLTANAPALPIVGNGDSQLERIVGCRDEAQVTDQLAGRRNRHEAFLVHVVWCAEHSRRGRTLFTARAQETGTTTLGSEACIELGERFRVGQPYTPDLNLHTYISRLLVRPA